MKKRSIEGNLHPDVGGKRNAAGGAATASDKQSRSSRQETTTRILDAAEDLFSRRDPAGVTVREIAEAAGVTHPLVHQYVGSKADIRRAVVERGAPRRQQLIEEHPDLREVIPLLAADVVSRQAHSRSIIRSAMDGVEYAPLEDRIKTGQMVLKLAQDSIDQGRTRLPAPAAVDPRIALAAASALMFGWVAVENWLAKMYGLDSDEIAEARRQMGEIAVHVAEMALPLPDMSSGDDR